ncbi:lysine transporter LysE [Candidatus Poribacteria bacterium]|nr:MAG: lysine transporter LysE [Candidatus Poribacteria bacterium]
MEVLKTFLTSFAVGFSGAVTPGPLLLIVISQTLRMGFLAVPLIITGHSLLELATTVGLAMGLKQVLDRPLISGLIGLGGGAVMLAMGIGMFVEALKEKSSEPSLLKGKGGEPREIFRPLGLGVVVSLSNPFWTIWWATVGAALVAKALEGGPHLVPAFYIGHILSDYTWYAAVGLGLVLGFRIIGTKGYRALLIACSIFLALFGIYFIYRGGTDLL